MSPPELTSTTLLQGIRLIYQPQTVSLGMTRFGCILETIGQRQWMYRLADTGNAIYSDELDYH